MLEVVNVSKRFGGLLAVDGASLTVAEGSIAGLIGPNGAGKTTLFSMIAGAVPPTAGEISFAGQRIDGLKSHEVCHRGIGRTFQITQPFAGLSVRENIAVGAHLHHRRRADALAAAAEVAKLVGMAALLDRPAASLTVAGRKRLELARALATRPRLLLLDEVMAGLNPTEIGEIIGVIRGIRDSGVTVLLTEHVMQAVMSLCEHIHVLNQGRVIAAGAPSLLVTDPKVVEAYLGRAAAGRIEAGARHAS
jgi:branched-chain amino acid transport system ATP-binding protein